MYYIRGKKSNEQIENNTKKKIKYYKDSDENKRNEYSEKLKKYDSSKIYYIDETVIDKFYYREYGYAPRNERIYDKVTGRKFKRINIVSAEQNNKFICPMQYEGNIDSVIFEHWFLNYFLTNIPENSVIIMDNASFHRKQNLLDLSAKHNCNLLFLPPYSPDLNPIEIMWANLKSFLSNYSSSFDSIQDAISDFFLSH